MARTEITVNDLPGFGQPTASDITVVNGDVANGNKLENKGRVILFVKNPSATPALVTVVSGVASPITNNKAKTITVTLDQNESVVMGPFEPQAFNQTSGDNLNTIHIDCDNASTELEAVRLPLRNAFRS